jgi:trimeric autotransporter adhesin
MKQLVCLMLLPAVLALCAEEGHAQSATITTYAGPSLPTSGSQATAQPIGVPQGVAPDHSGGFYISSSTQDRIYRVGPDGVLTVIAGNGLPGFEGDGGPATSAQFNYVHGLAVDGAGNLYIADTNNNRIRKITPGGVITTVAGKGTWGASGDGGPAVSAQLAGPRGLAVDAAGNLLIADSGNNRIRRVSPAGIITTIAGTKGGIGGDGGSATAAELNYPVAIAVHPNGNLFIADRYNHRVRMVNAAGVISTIAGSTAGFDGDGGPAPQAKLFDPRGVAVDAAGNVYIADAGNNRIRMVDNAGIIRTVVGSASAGFSGDGGPAALAQISLPVELAVDERGNLLIADRGNFRVRQVNSEGIITTVAGINDDGGLATSAQLNYPNGVAADAAGNIFIADTDSQRIRRISADGIITTVAGNGAAGFRGDGGPATSAQLNYPSAVAVDAFGNLFIADTRNQRIRKVTPAGTIVTVAGNGSAGFSGDGASALLARLNDPRAVAADSEGNLFIADSGNHRVRKVNLAGVISTVAGIGTSGFAGDNGPAAQAQLAFPTGVAVDSTSSVFIADSYNNRIRVVGPDGIIRTLAGAGTYGFSGDGGPASAAKLASPNNLFVDAGGNVFIADTDNQRIRSVTRDGIIHTVAGNGAAGFAGDGGPATAATLSFPFAVAIDGTNTLFIADTFTSRIRKVIFSNNTLTVINRGGGTTLTTPGTSPSLLTGYGRIQATPGAVPSGFAIFSYRSQDYLISETGVPASAPLRSGRIYAEVNRRVNTGVAIANPGNETATIHFYFTDTHGNDLGFATTTIPAKHQMARFLDSEPFNTFHGSNFQGTFTFMSDVPVGVIALRGLFNERNDFLMSTLPVIDISGTPPTEAMVVPHFAYGNDWTTQILLVNSADAPISGTVESRDDAGNVTATTTYRIQAHASQELTMAGIGFTTGSMRVVPANGDPAAIPLVVFSYRPEGGITISEAGVPSTSGTAFRSYVESSGVIGQTGSIQSGLAITNNSPAPTTVSLELNNLDGSPTGLPAPIVLTIPGLGHTAKFVAELFPGLPRPFRGTVRISSASNISVVGLRGRYNERNDFLITTTPPIREHDASDSTELLIPHLADGAGYTTQFVIFNGSGNQPASGSLLLLQNSGQPLGVTLR